jgi:F0F1-type ATP synthase delta subunit
MSSPADSNTADKPVTDIGAQRLARVYAQAILEAAEKAGCRAGVLDELRSLGRDVLPRVPGADRMFASPRITAEEKGAMIDKICGDRVLPTTLHSLHVLARHDRLGTNGRRARRPQTG